MLTARNILNHIKTGDIKIDNFDESQLNPNSYNLTLAAEYKTYIGRTLDAKAENKMERRMFDKEGDILYPGQLYIMSTEEYTETHNLIPRVDGRSSIGRLGIFVHVTAGFGDIGFCGKWTLEVVVVRPVILYAGIKICQISYLAPDGPIDRVYKGKYQGQRESTGTRLFKEM